MILNYTFDLEFGIVFILNFLFWSTKFDYVFKIPFCPSSQLKYPLKERRNYIILLALNGQINHKDKKDRLENIIKLGGPKWKISNFKDEKCKNDYTWPKGESQKRPRRRKQRRRRRRGMSLAERRERRKELAL